MYGLLKQVEMQGFDELCFVACFEANANNIYFYQQCTYIAFILQCHDAKILLKRTETDVVLIIFKAVPYNIRTYTVTVSYCSLDMNQAPEKLYLVYD